MSGWVIDIDRCFGYAQGVLGGLLTVPQFLERFPQVDTLDSAAATFHSAWVTGVFIWHSFALHLANKK